MDHPLYNPLKDKRFATDADVKQAVTSWLRTLHTRAGSLDAAVWIHA
jgi:hypothetical protein